MKHLALVLRPGLAASLIALGFLFSGNESHAVRLLDESFENFDANDDPIGWDTAGHPGYLRVRHESEGDWDTPYGEHAMSTYSSGVGTKGVGFIPTSGGSDNDGDYTVKFNISSFAAKGEYRAELWVEHFVDGWTLLGFVEGDTDGTKDFSYTNEITWRYNYADWIVEDFFGTYSALEGQNLRIRLMQDPNRSNWRHTPLWDNVTVDYIPDIDTEGPDWVDITDDNEGSEIVATNAIVTYTVSFNEAIDPTTLDSSDFQNYASADATIVSVSPTADPAVFLVEVKPTEAGNLRLGFVEGTSIADTEGNLMDTANTSELQDETTFTVEAGVPTILPSDFVDDQNGGPIAENTLVTYTLTFSKDMNTSTVSEADFENAGTAPITFGAITETSPGVFTVEVTPTASGTLQLAIQQNVILEAADGGQLNTSDAILDDTTIVVDSVLPTLTEFKNDAEGAPVAVGSLLTYEVFFSEDMETATVDASDFGNAVTSGNAAFTIDNVEKASPGLFRVEITPTSAGSIQLQVNAGAVLEDLSGNALDTSTAIVDPTVITVEAASSNPYDDWSGGTAAFEDDANGDGVSNGLAWLLGAADVNEEALARLPDASVNASGDLVLSFRTLKTANRGGALIKVQHSADLGLSDPWANNEAEVPDTDSTVNGIVFNTTDAGDYIDVTATIPASAAGGDNRLFGRIFVQMP